jgi:hypothetical protein
VDEILLESDRIAPEESATVAVRAAWEEEVCMVAPGDGPPLLPSALCMATGVTSVQGLSMGRSTGAA